MPSCIKCKKLNLMGKTSGNVFLEHLGGKFLYFSKVALNHGVTPYTFQNFCGCYNIQFKPCAIPMIELFVANR